jgi:3-oxoacyl-[acyl-carrier protein] reductase
MEFTGKVAVITGAASGIGRQAATLIGERGASVVIADVQEKMANDVVENLKARDITAQFIKTDITNIDHIRALFSETISTYKKLDILINCAGIGRLTRVPDITPEEWDLVLAVNLKSAFFCSQEALKYMCKRKVGKIINIASAAGKIGGIAVGAHYSASKAAIICLTKSLALYAAPFNITVNCVCPGPTVTPLTDEWGEELNTSFANKIPLKRYGTPDEIAEAICFLASDRANYITGETLDVNGGLVMD